MIHEQFYVSVEEWFVDSDGRTPADAMRAILACLMERGMRSLEKEMSLVLQNFVGFPADQSSIASSRGLSSRSDPDDHGVFVSCLKHEGTYVFVDMERPRMAGELLYFEFDVIAQDPRSTQSMHELLVEETMKCFGLTKTKEELVSSALYEVDYAKSLRDRLSSNPPIDDALFHRLQEERERSMLRELKKRGSILERDLGELMPPGADSEPVKLTLDFLSGEDYRLIERKYAIVCRDTGEIILPLRQREDFDKAVSLECPKCEKLLGEEDLMAYYSVTDSLRGLIDGNKWMPLLVRNAFLNAGVSPEDIYVEVKNGEDEIDVLVFHEQRIIAIEAKNRSVSLNDAYKLSAKRSRLERLARTEATRERILRDYLDDDPIEWVGGTDHDDVIPSRARRPSKGSCVPIIISTHDIAKDARDLLSETTEHARFLEQSDGRVDQFVKELIDEINDDELNRRLRQLTSPAMEDSSARLAAQQVLAAFADWRDRRT